MIKRLIRLLSTPLLARCVLFSSSPLTHPLDLARKLCVCVCEARPPLLRPRLCPLWVHTLQPLCDAGTRSGSGNLVKPAPHRMSGPHQREGERGRLLPRGECRMGGFSGGTTLRPPKHSPLLQNSNHCYPPSTKPIQTPGVSRSAPTRTSSSKEICGEEKIRQQEARNVFSISRLRQKQSSGKQTGGARPTESSQMYFL